MRSARLLALPAILALSLAHSRAQERPTETQLAIPPQATFKTDIDLVQLDVSVLDRNNRPVRGLTAADFTVFENGRPQTIVALLPVDVPGPITPTAAWVRDIGADVVSNDVDTRRLVVIVMDDAYTGIDRGESQSARQIATAIVEQLGPADFAAIAFTFLGRAQNFTTDRSQLLAAIASYTPKNWSLPGPLLSRVGTSGGTGPPFGCAFKRGGCLVDLLKHVGDLLQTAPPGRKMVLLISSQGTLSVSTDPFAPLTPVQEMFRALQQANATVFAFDPRGLTPGVKPDDLMSLTDATGGRTVAHTNEPESHVPEVFQQSGSYYLLGFQSINPRRDGRFRRVQVKVNRPDLIVRTRSGYFAPTDGQARRPSKTPLVRTLERGLPGTDLPMRVHVGTFAIPGRREAAVTLVTTVRDRAGKPGPRRLEILTAAFDTGWRERASHRQTIEFRAMPSGASDVEFDVLSRVALRPGRYELRLAAEMEGRTGSVLLNIDVPDFSKDPLTVSSVLLERSGGAYAGNDRLFADLIRVRPTAARLFRRTDTVSTFARVYWNATKVSAPVTVSSHITNERDEAVFHRRVSLPTDASGSDRAEICRIDLPLAQLPAGQYLLTLKAEAGPHRARRHMRFEVR